MRRVNVADAQAILPELFDAAMQGEEVVIVRDDERAAQLVPVVRPKGQRQFGSAKGVIVWMADDFDATPPDFAEYAPRGSLGQQQGSGPITNATSPSH